MDRLDRYPVIIETRVTHVVWIAADDQADALAQIKDSGGADLDQLTDASTAVDGDWTVRAPHGPYDMWAIRQVKPPADAHVIGDTTQEPVRDGEAVPV